MGLFGGGGVLGPIGDIVGGVVGVIENRKDRAESARQAADNAAMQRDFAQHGLQWKVADAVAAGLHPLAAIGASTAQASNPYQTFVPRNTGEMISRMGQNLSRSFAATSTQHTRLMNELQIENQSLQNEYLRKQIAQVGPPFPSDSRDPLLTGDALKTVGADPRVVDMPFRRNVSDRSDPSKEAGAMNDWQIVRTHKGYAVVPSQGVKQAIEDSPMEYQWLIRAALRTYIMPDGRKGRMNPFTGELVPVGESFRDRGQRAVDELLNRIKRR